tara:strand:- start:135 stop:311 length:177 start_codon:yes stop_codon:yes gene_type:complete
MSREKAIEICKNLKYTIENYQHNTDSRLTEQFESPKIKLSTLKYKLKKLKEKYKINVN